jgi:hypothetical protein
LLVNGVAFAGHAEESFGSAGQGDGPRAMGLADGAASAQDGGRLDGNGLARWAGGFWFCLHRFHFYRVSLFELQQLFEGFPRLDHADDRADEKHDAAGEVEPVRCEGGIHGFI